MPLIAFYNEEKAMLNGQSAQQKFDAIQCTLKVIRGSENASMRYSKSPLTIFRERFMTPSVLAYSIVENSANGGVSCAVAGFAQPFFDKKR